jgi:hypothetical protein
LLLVSLALGGCSLLPAKEPTAGYVEPDGRFVIQHPEGWSLSRVAQAGVEHWRWTPEPLADPSAEAPSELAFALIPLPPEAELTGASLEEVGEYVRDALIETAAEAGTRLRAGPPRSLFVGGKDAVRFDLEGPDAAGAVQVVSIVVVRAPGRAAVLSFGCSKEGAGALYPLLERCARTLRLSTLTSRR